jgi:hypothetical protein
MREEFGWGHHLLRSQLLQRLHNVILVKDLRPCTNRIDARIGWFIDGGVS